MHKTFYSFDYKLVDDQAVLEARVKPNTRCYFDMPLCAYKFRAEQLVVLVDCLGFEDVIQRDENIRVLRLYGGEYINTGPFVTVDFGCLEELHVESNDLGMTSFPLRITTLTLLERLRIVNFKLVEVPPQLKGMTRLVELDLSNNDLKGSICSST